MIACSSHTIILPGIHDVQQITALQVAVFSSLDVPSVFNAMHAMHIQFPDHCLRVIISLRYTPGCLKVR